MKLHHRWMILILIILCIFFISMTSLASEKSIKVYYDGEEVLFDEKPVVVNGVTLVQFRPIFEKMGMQISWDQTTGEITAFNLMLYMKLTLDKEMAAVNDEEIVLQTAPTNINGHTFVPLRFIAEQGDKEIIWNQQERTIHIKSDSHKLLIDALVDKNFPQIKYLFSTYDYSSFTKFSSQLLEKDINPNLKDVNGNSLLHLSITYSQPTIVQGLIQSKADLTSMNNEGENPLELVQSHYLLSIEQSLEHKETLREIMRLIIDQMAVNETIDYEEGDQYIGQIVNEFRNGYGTYIWADGDMYAGEWIDGYYSGYGTYTFQHGDVYEGDFLYEESHGQGTYTWSNGDQYIGEWKNDLYNGNGKFIYANGDIYEGEFLNEKKHGYGRITYYEGTVYEGYWDNDVQHGYGKIYKLYEEGYVEGHFVNGILEGNVIVTMPDGSSYEVLYTNNEVVEVLKQFRYKFKMKEADTEYDVVIYSEDETIRSGIGRQWACTNADDVIYNGTYQMEILLNGQLIDSMNLGDVTFKDNGLKDFSFIIQGEPDLLAISQCEGSDFNLLKFYMIKDGKITLIKNESEDLNLYLSSGLSMKYVSPQHYQSMVYSNEKGYVFSNWELDIENEMFIHKKDFSFDDWGSDYGTKWMEDETYIYID
ncbi:stalk domain-containing protein [Chengkuizengella axinellae]|uniref:Stalk domain-containing protein n=1 Tax=Chengkuizengella axinellae TaxID=3064388 RepID=A0ABT9IVG5_9BACL|nr:stalk domain-containing protein [Chengkuizengella sp. 2205SS18-9]MDP5272790.1 stalk domain-containing protein [Chengkuizengella sp. 2205SS18-9]